MKRYFKGMTVAVCIILGVSCTSMKEARKWAGGATHEKASIRISGFWHSDRFGPGKIEQVNDDISGSFRDYFVEGKVHGSTVYMILSRDNQQTDYTARLTATKEGNLAGKCRAGIMNKYSGSDILFTRETEATFRERLNKNDYFFSLDVVKITFSPASGMDEGRRWLFLNEGNPDAAVDGPYSNPEWGKGVILQKGSRITGYIGMYGFDGVINNKTVFLMIRCWNKVYYTAILEAGEKGTMSGKYYRGITYNVSRKGIPLVLVKMQ